MWLDKEEMLFLLERGGLSVWYAGGGMGEEQGWLSMSLQAAYALVFDGLRLSLEEWVVYEALKRAGFVVLRVGEEDEDEDEEGMGSEVKGGGGREESEMYGLGRLFRWLFGRIFFSSRQMTRGWMGMGMGIGTGTGSDQMMGPLVKPGLYRSYSTFNVLVEWICLWND